MSRRPLEIRSFPIETRFGADGSVGFRGYAAVFGQESHGEVIERGAFKNSLSIRDNVKFLVNHDGYPLASTSGETMTLREDDHGLLVEVSSFDVENNVFARALVSALKRGDMNKMSFAFMVDGTEGEYRDANGVRHVTRAKLFDVSVVNEPWYPGTNAELNSVDHALMCLRSLTPEEREMTLVALGDLNITAPITDSSTDNSVETETEDCCCDSCGGMTPADSNYCCCCGASMSTDAGTAAPVAEASAPRSYTIAEARALLASAAA